MQFLRASPKDQCISLSRPDQYKSKQQPCGVELAEKLLNILLFADLQWPKLSPGCSDTESCQQSSLCLNTIEKCSTLCKKKKAVHHDSAESASPAGRKASQRACAGEDFSMYLGTGSTLQDSMASGTGAYRVPVVCKNRKDHGYLWAEHRCRLEWGFFLFLKHTLSSLFPLIIISLNIVDGSGITGQITKLYLQTDVVPEISTTNIQCFHHDMSRIWRQAGVL